MITGANSGIGKATAQEIANRGEGLKKSPVPHPFPVGNMLKIFTSSFQAWLWFLMVYCNEDALNWFLFDLTGGTVHMVCRHAGRAEAARDEIVEKSTNQVRSVSALSTHRGLSSGKRSLSAFMFSFYF